VAVAATTTAPSALKWGARAGYAARGAVYLIVGAFAVLAAVGPGETEGTEGALRTILRQPLGGVLLAILAVGLLAFATWRFAQAIGDFDRHGSGAGGLVIRGGLFGSGIAHLALAAFAASFLISSAGSSEGGGGPTGDWLSWILGQGWGRWAALAIALIPVAVGIAHIIRAWRGSFRKYLEADNDVMKVVGPISVFGLVARGVVFLIVGLLALYGGGIYDAASAPGLQDALSFVQGLPFGSLLFLLTALGLVAFAIYCFVEAAYRRVGAI
jgi:hypothetical protein